MLGCSMLGKFPHWPPVEDHDRLLLLVLPAVVVVELVAAFRSVPRWLIWPVRAIVAFAVAPVLLYGTSYLSDQAGPGTAEWSTAQASLILGGLGSFLIVAWALLEMLSARAGGVTPAVCLAIAAAGTGLAVMISGYMSGGRKGLVLCGALSGLVVAALVLRWSMRGTRPLGVGIVAFYSLIVIGRFLGELSVLHAIVLAGSPLLAWVPELPLVRRLPRLARELARVLVVGLVVAAVVAGEVRQFCQQHAGVCGFGVRRACGKMT